MYVVINKCFVSYVFVYVYSCYFDAEQSWFKYTFLGTYVYGWSGYGGSQE